MAVSYVAASACVRCRYLYSFFFNDTATTEIYTLSLHDALPIWSWTASSRSSPGCSCSRVRRRTREHERSEEHTSELQSQFHLVCRLLLEKKKNSNFVLDPQLAVIFRHVPTRTTLNDLNRRPRRH